MYFTVEHSRWRYTLLACKTPVQKKKPWRHICCSSECLCISGENIHAHWSPLHDGACCLTDGNTWCGVKRESWSKAAADYNPTLTGFMRTWTRSPPHLSRTVPECTGTEPKITFSSGSGPSMFVFALIKWAGVWGQRARTWSPPVKTSSFTQHSQSFKMIERVVFRCLGRTDS